MSDPHQRRLREWSPYELERDRQPGSGKARGHGQSGEAQIVERPREARERSDDCESLRAAPQIGVVYPWYGLAEQWSMQHVGFGEDGLDHVRDDVRAQVQRFDILRRDRKSTRLNSSH